MDTDSQVNATNATVAKNKEDQALKDSNQDTAIAGKVSQSDFEADQKRQDDITAQNKVEQAATDSNQDSIIAKNKVDADSNNTVTNNRITSEANRQDSVNSTQNTELSRLEQVKADKADLDTTNINVTNNATTINKHGTELARLENNKLDKTEFVGMSKNVAANTEKNVQQDMEISKKADITYVDSQNKVQDKALAAQVVRGDQLGKDTATILGGGAQYNTTNGSISLPVYNVGSNKYGNVGDAFDATNLRIDDLENDYRGLRGDMKELGYKLSAGIASAAAMEDAPFVAGKYTYAVGMSHFNGEAAIGGTLRHTSVDGKFSMAGGFSTNTQNESLFKVGITGVID